jgi:hypothetical protein
MRSRASNGSSLSPALATIVVLCLPSLAYLAASSWDVMMERPGQRFPSNSAYPMIAAIHLLTFPWAYLIALGFGLWVGFRASRRISMCAWCILAVSAIANVAFWQSIRNSF